MPTGFGKTNQPQPDARSKSQQPPANDRPFKEPEARSPLDLGLGADAAQLDQDLDKAYGDVMAGLGAADMHWVAQTIIDEVASSTDRAAKLSEVIEHFRNPETTVKMAYVLAGKKIAGRQTMQIPRPAFNVAFPSLPSFSVPDFARFYQSVELSQPQLPHTTSASSESQPSQTSSGNSESEKN